MAFVALLLAGTAAAGQARAGDTAMAGMSMTGPMAAHGAADAAMQHGMARMQMDMRDAPMTGDPDHDFVAMMLPHHQGAVDMAKVELEYGKDPALLELSRRIIAAQDREIAFMKTWRAAHPDAKGATGTAR